MGCGGVNPGLGVLSPGFPCEFCCVTRQVTVRLWASLLQTDEVTCRSLEAIPYTCRGTVPQGRPITTLLLEAAGAPGGLRGRELAVPWPP